MAARKITRRNALYCAFGAASVLAAAQLVHADNFTWTGAAGNSWDLTTASWDNTTTATIGVPWTNNPTTTTPNLALFNLAVPPGAIGVNDIVFTGGLDFATTGWNVTAGSGSLSFGDVGTLGLNTNGTNSISATIQDTGAAATSVNVTGGGLINITGANTYTGTTTLSSGDVRINDASNLGTGSVVVGSRLLRINNSTSFDASRAFTINNGTIQTGSATLGNANAGPDVTIAGVVGGTALNKFGVGNLILTNTNTYTGITTTETTSAFQGPGAGLGVRGAIIVTANGALGTGDGTAATGTVLGATNNGILVFQGGVNYTTNERITVNQGGYATGSIRSTTGDNTFAGNIIMNAGSGYATTNLVVFGTDAGSSLKLTGVVSDDGQTHLVKVGAGNLIFENAMTYAGNTNVSWPASNSANTPTLNSNNQNGGRGLLIPAGTLTLGRSATGVFGSILNSPLINIGDTGALVIDNSTKTGGDAVSVARTGATSNLVLANSGRLVVNGTSAANTTDTFGILLAGGNYYSGNVGLRALGQAYIDVNPGTGRTSTLEFASARTAGAVVLVSGPNVGAAAGPDVAQVKIAGNISALGGYAHTFSGLGTTAAKTMNDFFVRDTLTGTTHIATYDTNGIRALNEATETETVFANAAGKNFRVGPGTTTVSSAIVQSLTMRGDGAVIDGTGILAVHQDYGFNASVLSTGTGNVINGPTLGFANPNYGFQPGVIYVEGDLTIASQLGDSAWVNTAYGITKAGPGELILTSTTNHLGGTGNLNYNYLAGGKLTLSSPLNIQPAAQGSPSQLGIYSGTTLKITGGGIVDFGPSNALNGNTTAGINLHFGGATTHASGQNPATVFIEVDTGTTFRMGEANLGSNGQNNGFTKIGAGILEMTRPSANDGIGNIFLNEGTLRMSDTSYSTGVNPASGNDFGTYARYGNVITRPGTTIEIDSTKNNAGSSFGLYGTPSVVRLGGVQYNSTTVLVTGNNAAHTADRFQESQTFASGTSTLQINPGTGFTSYLRGGYLIRNAGATVNYVGKNVGAPLGADVSQFRYGSLPFGISNLNTPNATVLPWATVNDLVAGTVRLATYDSATVTPHSAGSIRSLNNSEMTLNALNAGENIRLTASNATAGVSIRSLTLENTGTATDVANSGTLTITQGAILSTGTVGNSISGGTLDFGNAEGIVHAFSDLLVSSVVTGNSGLTKSGTGTLTLSNTNTYGGSNTWINQGTVSAAGSASLGSTNVGVVMQPNTTLTVTGAGLALSDNRALNLNFAGNRNINVNDATSIFGFVGGVSGAGNITKGVAGALVLNSNATPYTGNVALNAGTLGGSLSTTGSVTGGGTAHKIQPSVGLASNAVTTMTVGALTTNANTTIAVNLVTPNTSVNDVVNVTGENALTLGAGTTIQIANTSTGPASLGYYKVIQYAGTFNGALSGIVMPATVNKVVYLLDSAEHPGFIDIHRGFEGDANDDGTVAFVDFVALANNFGQPNTGWGGGDFNGDGSTSFADFVILANNFGQTIGGGALVSSSELALFQAASANFIAAHGAAVPEPASLALLGIGAAALLTRRRKA